MENAKKPFNEKEESMSKCNISSTTTPASVNDTSSTESSKIAILKKTVKSPINIIRSPKSITRQSQAIQKIQFDNSNELGLDKKSKSIMLHSARSKAEQLESEMMPLRSFLQPLKGEDDDDEDNFSFKETKFMNGIYEAKTNEFGAIEVIKNELISLGNPSMSRIHVRKEERQFDDEGDTSKEEDYDDDDDDDEVDEDEEDDTGDDGEQTSSLLEKADASSSFSLTKIPKDEILCCDGCGCYGMAGEFYNATTCSHICYTRVDQKKRLQEKKERELREQKLKRQARRREFKESREFKKVNNIVQDKLIKNPALSHQNWYDSKSGVFCWDKYMESTCSSGAPSRLFEHNVSFFPPPNNWFKVGMKLEAIDPEHPALVCIVSIAQIQGYRLRLHFDGFSDSYDFWENGDSWNIFPSNWSERDHLVPPKGYDCRTFEWKKYLQETQSIDAPERLFRHKLSQSPRARETSNELSEWKVGAKLEAVDKQNTSLICVASVARVMGGRILIHFDGWEMDYDYWVTPNSPYIHPTGWCEKNGLILNPPNDYPENIRFHWNKYLVETGSVAVPASAFKCRQETSYFKKGMKLEAVDPRNPGLIRVSTVTEVSSRQLKIHFDGWPNDYDVWIDDESPNIYPPKWCQKMGNHSLEPPLTPNDVKRFAEKGSCSTPGCRGIGNIKGAKFVSHHTQSACPYSLQNLGQDSKLPDRIRDKNNRKNYETRGGSKRGRKRAFQGEEEDHSQPKIRNVESQYEFRQQSMNPENYEIRRSVFRPGYWPMGHMDMPLTRERNSAFLMDKINGLSDVRYWTSADVVRFVTTLPGLEGDRILAERMYDEEVDGQSFVMLTQTDLVKILGLKLGPAIKIYHAIQILKCKSSS